MAISALSHNFVRLCLRN